MQRETIHCQDNTHRWIMLSHNTVHPTHPLTHTNASVPSASAMPNFDWRACICPHRLHSRWRCFMIAKLRQHNLRQFVLQRIDVTNQSEQRTFQVPFFVSEHIHCQVSLRVLNRCEPRTSNIALTTSTSHPCSGPLCSCSSTESLSTNESISSKSMPVVWIQ